MIRFVIAAVWICAVTVGSIFFAFQAAGKKAGAEAAPFFGGLDYISTDVISVPLIKSGSVQGYFLSRLVYTVEPEIMAKLAIPAETLLVDHVYSHLYDNPDIDFTQRETLDIDKFRNDLRDAINARLGETLIHDILVEQIDYLSKEEIRDNTLRRRIAPPTPEAPAVSAEPPH
jgi:hypothetical protein